MEKHIAIIFAGGTGVRMGAGLPKQFIEVYGKPIIIHTLEIFDNSDDIDSIYVACKEGYINKTKKLLRRYDIQKVKKIVPGGATGQDSIFNALSAAAEENPDDSLVLIHDGVRPCIGPGLIRKNIEMAREYGSSVTCTAMYETPIESAGGVLVEDTPERKNFYTAQAPQTFRLGDVMAAHEKIRKTNPSYEGIIDTCTLMKKLGKDVHILSGPRGNIKVTTPEDLYIFKAMLEFRNTTNVFGLDSDD
ncbi:MAG: 2-C-methyl-D-erythritol 4-phosphate cytidylyltransferase [Anaerovoracaceae bacterium]|jgi:2-C-methyl-D-erythritol 4-phosphate cytidylyltransferase